MTTPKPSKARYCEMCDVWVPASQTTCRACGGQTSKPEPYCAACDREGATAGGDTTPFESHACQRGYVATLIRHEANGHTHVKGAPCAQCDGVFRPTQRADQCGKCRMLGANGPCDEHGPNGTRPEPYPPFEGTDAMDGDENLP